MEMKMTPLITEAEISKRVSEIGAQISKDYEGKTPLILSVLKGSFMFCLSCKITLLTCFYRSLIGLTSTLFFSSESNFACVEASSV